MRLYQTKIKTGNILFNNVQQIWREKWTEQAATNSSLQYMDLKIGILEDHTCCLNINAS